jgi:hypothetical protein
MQVFRHLLVGVPCDKFHWHQYVPLSCNYVCSKGPQQKVCHIKYIAWAHACIVPYLRTLRILLAFSPTLDNLYTRCIYLGAQRPSIVRRLNASCLSRPLFLGCSIPTLPCITREDRHTPCLILSWDQLSAVAAVHGLGADQLSTHYSSPEREI